MLSVVPYFRFTIRTLLAAALTFAFLGSGFAQTQGSTAPTESGAENDSTAEVSKQASNPLASVWLMQIQQNNNWVGMPTNNGNRVQSNLQFQPLMSVKLTDDWSLVTRPVLQLVNSAPFPDQTGNSDRATGFGDTVLALALSPSRKLVGNWLLAAGPTFIFPTATDPRIGQDKWQVGPAAAFGYTGKNFITYVFPQQWFSVGDSGARARHMLMYYAFVYAFKNGWSVGNRGALGAARADRRANPPTAGQTRSICEAVGRNQLFDWRRGESNLRERICRGTAVNRPGCWPRIAKHVQLCRPCDPGARPDRRSRSGRGDGRGD
jgi:Putative MetA-pathway of phenol degradation